MPQSNILTNIFLLACNKNISITIFKINKIKVESQDRIYLTVYFLLINIVYTNKFEQYRIRDKNRIRSRFNILHFLNKWEYQF